ncbi:MAG TPA: TetR/AcrR family transcriptional regulator [Solirubrobacterales bacterium]|nr:TetR/AcrR family transcriptional regulator [Solirubrobacterales bacterium]
MASETNATSTETIRRTPRRKDRFEQMVSVAAEVFQQKGYDGASLQEIADAVGILKGSFYHYIDTKEDLLFEVIKKAHEGTASGNTAWVEFESEPLVAIRVWIEGHVRSSIDHLVYAAVYFREIDALAPERRDAINKSRSAYERQLRSLVEAAIDRGETRAGINPRLATMALFGMMNWIYYWYRPRGSLSVDEIVRGLADQGVASLTGSV